MWLMKLKSLMSTRNPQKISKKPGDACTEFHLHKSQIGRSDKKNLFDYTEHRLTVYISYIEDPQQKEEMQKILESYRKGLLAVAWSDGKPVWIKVTKETVG